METAQSLNPDLGLGINFCSMVQQHFSNACPVILCSHVQRRETVLWDKHTLWVKLTLILKRVLCVCVICMCKYVYLIGHINISLFGEQQGHEVHTALLCSKVEGADALTGHCVTPRPIFQQCCPNLQLILLSCNMKRCVAILERIREKQDAKIQNFFKWKYYAGMQ